MDSEHTYRSFALAYSRGMLPEDRHLDDDALLAHAVEKGLRLHRFKKTAELPRVRKVVGILQGFLPTSLLDIGTGRGTFLWPALDQLPDLHVTCIDSSEQRIKDLAAVRAGGLARIEPHLGDAATLPFADRSFDAATALEVLEHVADPIPVAEELLRTTRTVVIATVPAKPDNNPEHIRLFTRESLIALFVNAGASRVRIEHVLNHIVAIVRPAEESSGVEQ